MKKQCPKCKVDKELFAFNKSKDRKDGLQVYCKDCRKNYAQSSKEYQKDYRHKNADKMRIYMKGYAVKNKEKLSLKSKKYKEKLRVEALKRYGNKCKCCNEKNIDFLVIDHINGGGTKHRKELKGGSAIYQWLKDKKYPKGFRVLCHNCNWSIYRNKGNCSHKGGSKNDTICTVERKSL